MFIDFDRDKELFYINYYMDDFKIVVKIPIDADDYSDACIKIDKFNSIKYTYIAHFS